MAYIRGLVRLPDSGYTAQLRGVTGTITQGIVIQGVYSADWDAFAFDIESSGLYELYVDPLGGSSYSKDSVWSGADGRVLLGYDFALSLEP